MGNNYTVQAGETFRNGQGINPDYAATEIRKYKIGRAGVPLMNFNFAADAVGHGQQNLDLGFLLKAQCVPVSISIVCIIAANVVADFNISIGAVSAGVQYIPVSSCNIINETVIQLIMPQNINWSLANKLFLSGDPTSSTWDLMTAGQWELTLIYKDYSKV